jgi:hypothetical protein
MVSTLPVIHATSPGSRVSSVPSPRARSQVWITASVVRTASALAPVAGPSRYSTGFSSTPGAE